MMARYPTAMAAAATASFAAWCHALSGAAPQVPEAWAKNCRPSGEVFGTAGASQQGMSSWPKRYASWRRRHIEGSRSPA
ncbi:hypothetical protein G6F65_023402 [Rhizopus arrhizus]|nr:hypothetical protein G6F65_023402 [Rhizopus arrhizus]